jgi:hypothetical protein
MRDEIWAINQMQLGAFLENTRHKCPPPVTMITGSLHGGGKRTHYKVNPLTQIIVSTALVLAFYGFWIGCLFAAVYKRAHNHHAAPLPRRRSSAM